jgi:hypothetical protein
MFCCPHCSHLSTVLNNIDEPESCVTMWAAKHCSILFSSTIATMGLLYNEHIINGPRNCADVPCYISCHVFLLRGNCTLSICIISANTVSKDGSLRS